MNVWIIADYFFLIFHGLVILVNVFGWIPSRTRKLQLIALAVTLLSWFVLGIFHGWGYCFLTDWHWNVLAELNQRPAESAYVQYLVQRLFSFSISREWSDGLTIAGLIVGITGAAVMRIRTKKPFQK